MGKIKFLVILAFLGFSCSLKAQEGISLGLQSAHDFYYEQRTFRNAYGVGGQYFLSEHISLNNRILFGQNPANNNIFIHYGLGGLLTHISLTNGNVLFIGDNFVNDLSALVILPVIIPEGIQFHLGSDKFKFSPYIYPGSFEYNTFGTNDIKAFFETGASFRIITDKGLVISPNIGWKVQYGEISKQAISVGVMLGIHSD